MVLIVTIDYTFAGLQLGADPFASEGSASGSYKPSLIPNRQGPPGFSRREGQEARKYMSDQMVPITVAYGDGIGPEIMAATLEILKGAGARIAPEVIEIGEKGYLRGHSTRNELSAWDALRPTCVFLKAPINTPQGGGYKSLTVTTRKTPGLYA